MFDNVQTLPRYYDSNYTEYSDELPDKKETKKHAQKRREAKVKNWWYQEKVRQGPNRREMAVDEDFYDNIQWDPEDKAEMNALGQAALTFNEIHPTIEWIVGTEKRTRVDWKVLPRKKDHEKEASVKTGVLKFINDTNKLSFHRSRAFKQSATAGLSWMEYGHDEDTGDFPIFGDYESWRNVWGDSLATDWVTMKDWRYIHRSRIIDLDVAQAMFPNKRDALKRAADAQNANPYYRDDYTETQLYYFGNSGQSYTTTIDTALADSAGRRSRVKLIETWYREPVRVQRMMNDPEYQGQIFDPSNKEHAGMKEQGVVSLYDDVFMQMRVMMHIDEGEVLQDIASPYDHNRFPFVPLYAYIRAKDNQPYGVVRLCRDPQEDLNKRRSKILYLLSVRRTIMDEGAIRDMDAFEEEVSRPDSIIEKRKGFDLEIHENNQVAQAHLDLERQDAAYIRELSGVTGENLGLSTNATSGVAINARRDQGTTVTASLFDNLRLHTQLSGELMLSLSEQYLTDEDEFRITGDRNTFEFIEINKPDENGEMWNNITAHAADFVVDESDFRESQRIAMFETMANMLSQWDSEISIQLLDLLVDLTDLPQRQEMVSRIRKINGQVDPESETEEEREEREAAQAEAEEEQRQIQLTEIKLGFEERAAKIDKTRKDSAVQYVKAFNDAVQAAGASLQQPILGQIAELMVQEGLEPVGQQQMQEHEQEMIA